MELKQVERWVLKTLETNPFFEFDKNQIAILVSKVMEEEIIDDYVNCYFTAAEVDNMIIHIASELAAQFPNKGSFPKPPKQN